MSSTCSAESVVSALACNAQECGPLPSAKSMNAARKSSESTGPMCQTSETCEPQHFLEDLPKSSAADSPVKTLVAPGNRLASAAIDPGCGLNMQESFATFDRLSSSWKTSQLCLDGELSAFLETWPRSGTMRNGSAYKRRQSVIRIPEIGSGLLPTVTVKGNYNRVGASATSGDGVATKVKRLTGFYPAAEFCEVMMGYPPHWTELPNAEMRSFRKSRKQLAGK